MSIENIATREPPTKCDACGTSFPASSYTHSYERSEIEIAPRVSVYVCTSERGKYAGAKIACARKAIESAHVCPGCGVERATGLQFIGQLCNGCHRLISEARTARAAADTVTVRIYERALPSLYSVAGGDSAVREGYEDQRKLVEAIGRAVAPDKFNSWNPRAGGESWPELIELPKPDPTSAAYRSGGNVMTIARKQLEPLRAVVDLITKLFHTQRRAGRLEGESLLVRLSRGEASIDQFDHEARKAREAQAPERRNERAANTGQVDES